MHLAVVQALFMGLVILHLVAALIADYYLLHMGLDKHGIKGIKAA